MEETYTVKVGEATPAAGGKPSAGPVYRSIYAKDGLMKLPEDILSPWDFFRLVSWHGAGQFDNALFNLLSSRLC